MMGDFSSAAIQTERSKFGDHKDLRGHLYKLFMDIPLKCQHVAMVAMVLLYHALSKEVSVFGHPSRWYLSRKIANCNPNLAPVNYSDRNMTLSIGTTIDDESIFWVPVCICAIFWEQNWLDEFSCCESEQYLVLLRCNIGGETAL